MMTIMRMRSAILTIAYAYPQLLILLRVASDLLSIHFSFQPIFCQMAPSSPGMVRTCRLSLASDPR